MDTIDSVLEHFGVKGMRWGVRRANPSAGSESSGDSTRANEIKGKIKKSGTKSVSNKELQDLITRMNLERQYKSLNPPKTQKALKFASDILLGVGKQQAIRVLNDVATKKIGDALKSA